MGTMPDGGPNTAQIDDGITPVPGLPPTAVDESVREAEERKWTPARIALWVAIALLGGVAWFMRSSEGWSAEADKLVVTYQSYRDDLAFDDDELVSRGARVRVAAPHPPSKTDFDLAGRLWISFGLVRASQHGSQARREPPDEFDN